jgi:hypothetical protein
MHVVLLLFFVQGRQLERAPAAFRPDVTDEEEGQSLGGFGARAKRDVSNLAPIRAR